MFHFQDTSLIDLLPFFLSHLEVDLRMHYSHINPSKNMQRLKGYDILLYTTYHTGIFC